jgi:hypothetical protein
MISYGTFAGRNGGALSGLSSLQPKREYFGIAKNERWADVKSDRLAGLPVGAVKAIDFTRQWKANLSCTSHGGKTIARCR